MTNPTTKTTKNYDYLDSILADLLTSPEVNEDGIITASVGFGSIHEGDTVAKVAAELTTLQKHIRTKLLPWQYETKATSKKAAQTTMMPYTIEDYPQPGQRVRFVGCDQLHSGKTGQVRGVHSHPLDGSIVVNLDLDATADRPAHGCLLMDYPPQNFQPI